jgi:hypothetical protein
MPPFANKPRLLFIVLYGTILISCTPFLSVKNADTPVPTKTSLTQPHSTVTSTTVVPLPTTTSTSLPLPTATPPLPTYLALMCERTRLESVEEHVPGLRGILAYVVPADPGWERGDGQSGIVGGTPLQSRLFPPISNIEVIGFSPDGNWFAYNKSSGQPSQLEPLVYLLSSQGQTVITSMPAKAEDETLSRFMTWISDSLLLIQYYKLPSDRLGTAVIDSYAIIDAFTGEERNEFLENLSYWDRWTRPYFSPDMTRAVYVTDSRSPLGTSLALWDIERQTLLRSKEFRSGLGVEENYIGGRGLIQTAFWAWDSSRFVFTTREPTPDPENERQYSSYLVDRDGVTERLLVTSPTFSDVMVLGGLWSPDGRFIYYFIHGNSFVYDLALNQVIDLCANYSTHVAWSPDSTYLAYVGRVNEELHLLLFNIYTGEVSSVSVIEDVFGLEWVTNEDWLNIPDH